MNLEKVKNTVLNAMMNHFPFVKKSKNKRPLPIRAGHDEELLSNRSSSQKNEKSWWMIIVILAIIFLIAIISFTVFLVIFRRSSDGAAFIPQPFTENNDFSSFTLSNDLRVLLVRPNKSLNQTFVCEFISAFCWCWLGT